MPIIDDTRADMGLLRESAAIFTQVCYAGALCYRLSNER